MNAAEASKAIRGYAAAGRVWFTRHARERMALRGAHTTDVLHALRRATSVRDDGGKWRVVGPDLDGDELSMVIALEGGAIVVTVF